jgi:hypothetical protein
VTRSIGIVGAGRRVGARATGMWSDAFSPAQAIATSANSLTTDGLNLDGMV